ncbi:transglycosylase SLT domain-containing protein [Crocinitomix algicola]|uniref:transglycosylase SLT domain-containing protein n=1 Tax=Crocinitomix algicola TaxID=1740263 RepID=UPI0008356DBE|nr:transglycosylase SLT domain-containing protein [Crocinitomix algicola]
MIRSIIVLLFLVSTSAFSQHRFNKHLIEVTLHEQDTLLMNFVKTPDLFMERWDTLAQPSFWKFVMRMSPETSILNVAETRQVLELRPLADWNNLSDEEKEAYRDTLRIRHGLAPDTRIFMTTGKSDFFEFEKVFNSISRGVEVFKDNNTDPWYAQSILMIESPGKIAYSSVGALGPFQLMKSVARNHGLRVDKYVDERKDFDKSAKASAHLIRTACIPEAKRILKKFDIHVTPDDEFSLWFRLLVMHCYHAGAGNVDRLLSNVVKPTRGGMELITTIWRSEYGGFKNASQNYSQLALAALIILDDLILKKCQEICEY